MKIIDRINYFGLAWPVIITPTITYLWTQLFPKAPPSLKDIVLIWLCSHLISLYIWSQNIIAKKNGRKKFGLLPVPVSDADSQASMRERALNKDVPEELLRDKPTGIILGKSKGKYVAIEPGRTQTQGAFHMMVLGGSGSGKTSSVIAAEFLAMYTKWGRWIPTVYVDVKGEITQKFVSQEDIEAGKVKIFNPKQRNGWGFDFLYDINENSTEQEVYQSIRRLVYSQFPIKQSDQNSFWVEMARNVTLGIFLHGYIAKGMRTPPDLADYASSKDLKTLINEIIAETEEGSIVYKMLVQFSGDSAAETISSIAINMNRNLSLLTTDEDLRYLLRECPRKISPQMLENGDSIALQVSDKDLDIYAPILNLQITTIINYLMSEERERAVAENPDNQIVILADELGRILSAGKIDNLPALLQIGRSRGCSFIGASQSWSPVKAAYGDDIANDMLTNIPYRVFLQVQPDSQHEVEMITKAFGKYTERKQSISQGKNKSNSYSYEDKDVIRPDDLLQLPSQGKVVILTPFGAFIIAKVQYFKDKYLSKIAQQIKEDKANKK